MYKLYKSQITSEVSSVIRLSDMASIPFDPQNSDYAEYLRWVAEGGVPTPADEEQS